MKNNFISNNITTISKGVLFFSMLLAGLLFFVIYHAITYPKIDTVKQISSITTLPDLALCVGIYENRIPSYENPNTLYPDIEMIDYLGFVYDK